MDRNPLDCTHRPVRTHKRISGQIALEPVSFTAHLGRFAIREYWKSCFQNAIADLYWFKIQIN